MVKKKESEKIMVFSMKGGSGKSFLAVNLAIDLFNRSKKSVVLIDLNYHSGDVSIMLNLLPKNTIYEIISIIDQLDDKTIDSFLSDHNSGIKVLPSPKFPAQAEAISAELTMKVVDLLSRNYNYLVIDTGSYFSEMVLLLLEKIDYLCLISSMDVPNIKNLKLSLQVLRNLKFPMDKIYTIINRANSNVGMTISEIEDTIDKKIDIKIPSSKMVTLTINKGIPLIIDQPRSPISRSINELTKLIIK
jgi:pilus assembly protein CpaE